jgi:transposase
MIPILALTRNTTDTSLWALDETGTRLENNNYYYWSPKGTYIPIEHNGVKRGLNIIGATEISKHFDFIYDEYIKGGPEDTCLCAIHTIKFLEKLLEYDAARGINVTFVIIDNSKIHTAELVSEFAKKNADRLFLLRLPTYSPKLNPQEYMWKWMKSFLAKAQAYKCVEELSGKINQFQHMIRSNFALTQNAVYAGNYYK